MAGGRSNKSIRRSKTHSSKQPSQVPHNIAQAIVAKDEDLFFLTDSNGELPVQNSEGFGLYYHDCRFLDLLELRRLRVGKGSVDLRFERIAARKLKTHVLKTRGRIDIDIS